MNTLRPLSSYTWSPMTLGELESWFQLLRTIQ